MVMELNVRDARSEDAAALIANNSAMARETEGKTLDPHRIGPGVAKVLADESLGRYWVAENGGTVVGQIMVTYEWSDWRNGNLWWIQSGAPLAAEVDFLAVHSYPAWEGKTIDEALAFTIENVDGVREALPGKQIVLFEAGWATIASEFGERASEANQARYFEEMSDWAAETRTTVFFFEAFDEPWKGDPNNPLGAEKHWGLFNVDRTPKEVMR